MVVEIGDPFGHETRVEQQLPEAVRGAGEMMVGQGRSDAGIDPDEQDPYASFHTVGEAERRNVRGVRDAGGRESRGSDARTGRASRTRTLPPRTCSRSYLLSLKPGGTAISSALTVVATFSVSEVVVMTVTRSFGPPAAASSLAFFCAMRFPKPPMSPLTLVGGGLLDDLVSPAEFCSAAICSADFTASIVVTVRMGVPCELAAFSGHLLDGGLHHRIHRHGRCHVLGEAPEIIGPKSASGVADIEIDHFLHGRNRRRQPHVAGDDHSATLLQGLALFTDRDGHDRLAGAEAVDVLLLPGVLHVEVDFILGGVGVLLRRLGLLLGWRFLRRFFLPLLRASSIWRRTSAKVVTL